jgi:hypothetical protein
LVCETQLEGIVAQEDDISSIRTDDLLMSCCVATGLTQKQMTIVEMPLAITF